MKPHNEGQTLNSVSERLMNAYEKGYDIGFHNLGLTNPYPSDCLEYQCWITGRDQGAKELKLNL